MECGVTSCVVGSSHQGDAIALLCYYAIMLSCYHAIMLLCYYAIAHQGDVVGMAEAEEVADLMHGCGLEVVTVEARAEDPGGTMEREGDRRR